MSLNKCVLGSRKILSFFIWLQKLEVNYFQFIIFYTQLLFHRDSPNSMIRFYHINFNNIISAQINYHQNYINSYIPDPLLMSSQNKDYTPSKFGKPYDPQTTTLSYARQNSDRKTVQQLKDRTNQNPPSYHYQRDLKHSEVPTRYMQRQNMTLMREYQALKLKVRQLEAQNKQLEAEVDKIDYEKSYVQKQFKQKLAFEQESLLQFQKQKNYQLQLLQIKNEEDLSKLRREYELQIDEVQKQLKNSQYSNRQKIEQINYLEIRTSELKKELENVERELIKSRQNNSIINQKLAREQFNSKRVQTLLEDVQRQKNQMEMEIHVLLDIEAEKSRTINALEVQLCNTQASERSLQEKVTHLTENFADLEAHITLMKERLLESDQHALHLEKTVSLKESEIAQNRMIIHEQKEREGQLRKQLDINITKMSKREKEVEELMAQNERLYRQLNKARHQLHEISINHGIDV